MQIHCPHCNADIQADDINTLSKIVKCDRCNATFPVHDLIVKKTPDEIIAVPEDATFISEIKNNETIKITYPTKGFTKYMVTISIFMIIWFGIVAFFTYKAFSAGIFFTLFTIPFWFIGLKLVAGLINSVTETQTFEISKSSIKLVKERLIKSQTTEISLSEINDIRMKKMEAGLFKLLMNFKYISKAQHSKSQNETPIPSIEGENETLWFCEDGTDFEQNWITSTLKEITAYFQENQA